jgi:hypothetical protein
VDDVGPLIATFKARTDSSVAARLDALMDIERLDDPRVVPLLLEVLADDREPLELRVHVLKRLREASHIQSDRQTVARAVLEVLHYQDQAHLRLNAILALAEFADIDGVPAALGELALDADLPLDVRYYAFTSLERAGATTECVALVRRLVSDDTLGAAARSLLLSWRIALFLA